MLFLKDKQSIESHAFTYNLHHFIQSECIQIHLALFCSGSGQVRPLREFYFSRYTSYSNTHNAFVSIQKMWLASLSCRPEQEIIKELLWSVGDLKFTTWLSLERKGKARLQWGLLEEQMRKVEKRQQAIWISYNCNNRAWIKGQRDGRLGGYSIL